MKRLPWNTFAIIRFFAAFILTHCVLFAQAAPANGPINYVYDELGRLVGVSDATGNSATYKYDAVGNILTISRATAAQVSLSEFTPNGGPVGTTVTIFGSGFSATAIQNTVTFNLTAATVISATTTKIVASVPAGATTGTIKITTPTGSVTSASVFTVGPSLVPTIASFTPTVGSAGTAVTISGSNYQTTLSNNKVQFNKQVTAASSATATSIVAPVPASTTSGKIAVLTPYGTAISSADFFIPPSPYTAADIQVTDRMTIGQSKTVTIATAGKKGLILFDGIAGQRVDMVFSAVSIGSGTASILKPDGTVLGSTALSTSGGFIDAQTLPATGTYTIFLNPSATSLGSVTMALNNIQDVTSAITIGGPAVTVSTTVPGQNARLTFSGTAGQKISLNATGSTFAGCYYISILNPDGTALVNNAGSCSPTYFSDALTLPASGVFIMVVNPSGSTTGSITLQLYAVPADANGSITIGGPAVTLTTTVPGQNASLTFSGSAGQRISLNVTAISSSLSCPYFSIVNPDGTNLVAPGISCATTFFTDVKTLPATGTYTIVMNPGGALVGSATFTVYDVPPDASSSLTIGGPAVTLTTTVPGQNASLTFSGTAGQQATVHATGNTMGCETTSLLKPDGSALTSVFSCSASSNLVTQTLPTTGSYSISIDPGGINIGNISAAVTSP